MPACYVGDHATSAPFHLGPARWPAHRGAFLSKAFPSFRLWERAAKAEVETEGGSGSGVGKKGRDVGGVRIGSRLPLWPAQTFRGSLPPPPRRSAIHRWQPPPEKAMLAFSAPRFLLARVLDERRVNDSLVPGAQMGVGARLSVSAPIRHPLVLLLYLR